VAGRKDRFDWPTFALYGSLVLTGWLMLYAVGYSEFSNEGFELSSTIGRQTVWVCISLLAFAACQYIDTRFWRTFAYPIYIFSLLLLIGVLLFGEEVKGARSWIMVAGFSFQPSEVTKFAVLLALSTYLGFIEMRMRSPQAQMTAIALIMAPAILILLQPDAGSALVFASFFILFFREGLPATYYIIGLLVGVCLIAGLMFPLEVVIISVVSLAAAFMAIGIKGGRARLVFLGIILLSNSYHLFIQELSIPLIISINAVAMTAMVLLAWLGRQKQLTIAVPALLIIGVLLSATSNFVFEEVLEPHQQDRINVWLKPSQCDPQGALYNIIQSKVAIGSGGLTGKGFLQGSMTKLNFVPEQSTDFIFSTIGEEQGFLGSSAVILLYLGLLLRILYVGERAENTYLRHYAYGLAGMLFFHFFVNIGMTMGLVPVVGIPLPFISKGGSALLSFSIMLSVFLKMAKSRF
jgi:rod shape determining protein RodA